MRMTDLQGALGSAQMERAKEIVDERRMLAKTYNEVKDRMFKIRLKTK